MRYFKQALTLLLLQVFPDVTQGNQWPNLDLSIAPLQNEFPSKCFKDLGCFETSEPFYHPLLRPIVLLPFDEEHISTRFLLYTARNPMKPQLVDHSYKSIAGSTFNPYCPTKILIHGFSVKPSENNEFEKMKNAILSTGFYNVILVNWSDSNQSPYFQAIANGRVVGAQIARLIQALMLYTGANPEKFHIIGHSLGAAVAGWAGERIQNLGRITGLDPAGMYFYLAPPVMRLDTSDAIFVDVIVTNGGTSFEEGIGTIEPIGHVNFYPNGGNFQPVCFNASSNMNEFDFARNLCSHMTSIYLFIESILNDRCRFVGTPCENYESFLAGNCNNQRFWWRSMVPRHSRSTLRWHFPSNSEMGFRAKKRDNVAAGQKFYLKTNAMPPFCLETYNYNYNCRHFVKY